MKFKIVCDFCSQIMRISVSGLIWIMRTVSVLIWRKIDLRSPCSLYSLNGLHPELCSTISPWEEVDLQLKKRLRLIRLPLQIRNIFSVFLFKFLSYFPKPTERTERGQRFLWKTKQNYVLERYAVTFLIMLIKKSFFLMSFVYILFPPKKQKYGT